MVWGRGGRGEGGWGCEGWAGGVVGLGGDAMGAVFLGGGCGVDGRRGGGQWRGGDARLLGMVVCENHSLVLGDCLRGRNGIGRERAQDIALKPC